MAKTGLTLQRLGNAGKLTWPKKALGDPDMRTLAALPLPALQELDLRYNAIGDAGCVALATASAVGLLPNLCAISLSNNRIGDAGARALASATSDTAAPAFAELETLSLAFNKIGVDGMAALALAFGDGAMPKIMWSSYMLVSNRADDGIVGQALSQPSAARRASLRGEPGSIGGAHAAMRKLRTAGGGAAAQLQLLRRRAPVEAWNSHGTGIDVAAQLNASYRTGTLL